MKRIRVIQVGVGGRGKAFVNALREDERFVAAAYVDVNEDAIKAATRLVPVEGCFSDVEKALAEVEADAVFIITPPQLHAPQCHLALDRGKHVLVEKPFTKSLSQAEDIVRKAEEKGLKLVVSQNARYGAKMQEARELIEGGTYGRVCAGMVFKSGYRGGVHHSGEDAHSYLWERGVHDIDTLLHLVHPRKARRLSARSFNPPFSPYRGGASACGWIEFDDGAVFALNLSFMAHARRNEFVIECEQAAIVIGSEISVRHADGDKETITVEGSRYKDSVGYILDGFYDYITKDEEPPVSGRGNLSTVAIVEALGRSSDANAVVELNA